MQRLSFLSSWKGESPGIFFLDKLPGTPSCSSFLCVLFCFSPVERSNILTRTFPVLIPKMASLENSRTDPLVPAPRERQKQVTCFPSSRIPTSLAQSKLRNLCCVRSSFCFHSFTSLNERRDSFIKTDFALRGLREQSIVLQRSRLCPTAGPLCCRCRWVLGGRGECL